MLGAAHRFNDDKKGGHGRVDMYKSIVASCDTYYYQLASELDIDDLAGVLKQFGFGQKSGIDIEGELTGVLPSREWKRQRFAGKQYREEHRKWYLGDNISVGIGQGYNAYTPLQLAHAVSTLATAGVAYKPHLLKSIQNTKTGASPDTDAPRTRSRSRPSTGTSCGRRWSASTRKAPAPVHSPRPNTWPEGRPAPRRSTA
jgi:penicillin-binding protein 2